MSLGNKRFWLAIGEISDYVSFGTDKDGSNRIVRLISLMVSNSKLGFPGICRDPFTACLASKFFSKRSGQLG